MNKMVRQAVLRFGRTEQALEGARCRHRHVRRRDHPLRHRSAAGAQGGGEDGLAPPGDSLSGSWAERENLDEEMREIRKR